MHACGTTIIYLHGCVQLLINFCIFLHRVVQYQNTIIDSKSVCTWSGQYQEIDGEPKIITTWLLTSQTEPKDNWSSVQVNKDIFSRDYRDANAD